MLILKTRKRMVKAIFDQQGKEINIAEIENIEQQLTSQLIEANDVVLELGARQGSVSCTINEKLANKKNQVVVEPDERVWDALEKNRAQNECEFHIVKGFLSQKKLSLTNLDICYGGYAATSHENPESTIPSWTFDEIKSSIGISKFNVLVADCEGFLGQFFDENPDIIEDLRLIIFEADYPDKCDQQKIHAMLKCYDFVNIVNVCGQCAYIRRT